MSAIISSASLIKKVYVPKYLFVLSRVMSSFINLMASFTALLLVMVATRVELHWTVFLSVIPLAMVVLFFWCGMFLAAITVRFRDVIHLYSVFTTGLLYLTPVIYPMAALPDVVKTIVMINPLTNYPPDVSGCDVPTNTLPSVFSVLLGIAEGGAGIGAWSVCVSIRTRMNLF